MKTNRRTSSLLLSLLLFAVLSFQISAEELKGKVVKMLTEDTFVVRTDSGERKVRLFGIEGLGKDQPFGKESFTGIKGLLFEKDVTLKFEKKDKWEHAIAKVYVGDEYINKKAVEMGLAWYSKKYAPDDTDLADAMKKARTAKIGLWKDANPTPPWEFKRNSTDDGKSGGAKDEAPGKKTQNDKRLAKNS